jgi:hypothetical protein
MAVLVHYLALLASKIDQSRSHHCKGVRSTVGWCTWSKDGRLSCCALRARSRSCSSDRRARKPSPQDLDWPCAASAAGPARLEPTSQRASKSEAARSGRVLSERHEEGLLQCSRLLIICSNRVLFLAQSQSCPSSSHLLSKGLWFSQHHIHPAHRHHRVLRRLLGF